MGNKMKILEQNGTPNSDRVRMLILEKNISVSYEQVNSSEAEHNALTGSHVKPFQRVPALILDDGQSISEITAICRYLEESQSQPVLMGEDPMEKAEIEMWNKRIELYLFDFLYQQTLIDIPGWAEINRPKAEEAFSMLNDQLTNNQFISGKSFSLADISAFVAIRTLISQKVPPSRELEGLENWYRIIANRPSAQTPGEEEQRCSA